MAALYFHIPFCKRLCGYCDFLRSVKVQLIPQVAEQMHKELEEQHNFLTDNKIKTIYFGGGTPSLLQPSEIERFIDRARELFDCSAVEEITVEVNPDDITEHYVAELSATSVNRISMGIQSLDDNCLKFMGRRHNAEQAVEAVKRLRAGGFHNISVDLIFGVDGFGGESLERTLQGILSLDVEHISAYHLTIEPTTHFGRALAKGELKQVSEQRSEEEFIAVHQALTAAGYEHYEVSNFALPNRRSKHNSNYWNDTPYIGLGAGAHSYDGTVRSWNISDVDAYIEQAMAHHLQPEQEILTEEQRHTERVMLGLRTNQGISSCEINLSKAMPYIEQGLLTQKGERIMATTRGYHILNRIIEDLL